MKIQDKVIDMIVVSGKTHEECFEYVKNQYQGSGQRFTIVVTRDIHNTAWNKKFSSILEGTEINTTKDRVITDPGFKHCGYQNLISSCFNSGSLTELSSNIAELVGI